VVLNVRDLRKTANVEDIVKDFRSALSKQSIYESSIKDLDSLISVLQGENDSIDLRILESSNELKNLLQEELDKINENIKQIEDSLSGR
jgi:peptidoglycan hydrolase CwlO-like protein